MPDILLPIIALLAGFILLIWSADTFTENGAKIANIFKVSPLVIGLLIFGFGTSAPEMLVSGLAAINGNTGLSIGNAIGSNIFNIALVLGVSAIIAPIEVKNKVLKKEWLFLMLVTLVAGFLLWDKHLGVADGLVLVFLLIVFLTYTLMTARNSNSHEFDEFSETIDKSQTKKTWVMLIVGLVVLISSAKLIVWGGVEVAKFFEISDLIIGLSVIALGTSLPELAVSISSVLKKQYEMVVGNVIGSNLFNTIAVLAIPGLIHPSKVADEIIVRDYPVMLLLTLLLFILSYKFHKKHRINRFEGIVLVSVFSIYMWQLF
ncbi:calcium/sodium antiporter [bacterium endosymbiont of Bathymodiolus sp. 5 South]|jgi:cation:H+ antiporter|uniref:calcium/sodium antiporter n=1 Tax=bacterium endosymbiont of Bathymodiolus sp. 5 South TaxID=1181670 RepID=UPI0010BACED6|nr:calcium/sodium antiporter [bacterium endosymbiont of Bathymodiolus sp. 5 South]CAC9632849.1 Inner membrane protein YrbG, predicted calcium/sodium:proton antiporter [uncultured Gammaproteobacteria bacterium]CAC9647445.1 Inner membrane protein YrbG, predicted calcium/sodium:proton antiporter [uncultured Gammaproteobacteria bacterium]CAC9655581.1 Inner membrane protein YrbG, predicted calcium/sodium:proton antiporter [uncultured Gammaproteobacteria bacterium]SHN89243.1 Inner membrane protein Yr